MDFNTAMHTNTWNSSLEEEADILLKELFKAKNREGLVFLLEHSKKSEKLLFNHFRSTRILEQLFLMVDVGMETIDGFLKKLEKELEKSSLATGTFFAHMGREAVNLERFDIIKSIYDYINSKPLRDDFLRSTVLKSIDNDQCEMFLKCFSLVGPYDDPENTFLLLQHAFNANKKDIVVELIDILKKQSTNNTFYRDEDDVFTILGRVFWVGDNELWKILKKENIFDGVRWNFDAVELLGEEMVNALQLGANPEISRAIFVEAVGYIEKYFEPAFEPLIGGMKRSAWTIDLLVPLFPGREKDFVDILGTHYIRTNTRTNTNNELDRLPHLNNCLMKKEIDDEINKNFVQKPHSTKKRKI